MGGYKKHDPTCYVVMWPNDSLVKVGFTAKQRWRKFELRGAEVLALFEFEKSHDAFECESVGHHWLRDRFPYAFGLKDESVQFLGADGGGWAECFRASEADAQALLKHMLKQYSKECTQRTQRTQLTNASKTQEEIVTFINVRVGLWISGISESKVTS